MMSIPHIVNNTCIHNKHIDSSSDSTSCCDSAVARPLGKPRLAGNSGHQLLHCDRSRNLRGLLRCLTFRWQLEWLDNETFKLELGTFRFYQRATPNWLDYSHLQKSKIHRPQGRGLPVFPISGWKRSSLLMKKCRILGWHSSVCRHVSSSRETFQLNDTGWNASLARMQRTA